MTDVRADFKQNNPINQLNFKRVHEFYHLSNFHVLSNDMIAYQIIAKPVEIYNIRNRENKVTLKDNIHSVSITPEGDLLTTSTMGNDTIELWEIESIKKGKPKSTIIGQLNTHSLYGTQCVFPSPGEYYIAFDNIIYKGNYLNKSINRFLFLNETVTSLSLADDNNSLICADTNKIVVIDLSTHSLQSYPRPKLNPWPDYVFLSGNKMVESHYNKISIFDLALNRTIAEVEVEPDNQNEKPGADHIAHQFVIKSPINTLIAITNTGKIKEYDPKTLNCLNETNIPVKLTYPMKVDWRDYNLMLCDESQCIEMNVGLQERVERAAEAELQSRLPSSPSIKLTMEYLTGRHFLTERPTQGFVTEESEQPLIAKPRF